MGPIRFDAEPYRREAHEGFVKSSWCRGAREAWEVLARHLRRPDTRCLVATVRGAPSELLGWAAVAPRGVLWAYTRRSRVVRLRGVMTGLLLKLGIDVASPTACLFWSPDAAAIAARGYGFVYAPRGLKEAA